MKNVQNFSENTHMKNTNRYPAKNGNSAFAISPIESSLTDLETCIAEKILIATGGVMQPMTLEIHIIIPKCTTCIPILSAIGHNTGTNKTQIAEPSIKVPNISRIIATIKQKNVLLKFMPITSSTNTLEAPQYVNIHEKAVEVPIINSIIAELFTDFIRIFTTSPRFNSL